MASVPLGRMRFRPQMFWQEVLPQHLVDASLQLRADIASGKNFARIASEKEYASDGALARAAAVALADIDETAPDAEAVARALRSAVAWGDPVRVRHLLCSCYCGIPHLTGALHEAAARGESECVEVLLAAGAKPDGIVDGKTALHAACQEGQEQAGRALLAADPTLCERRDVSGRTPFDVAIDLDHSLVARRLLAFANELRATAQ
ncbi:MAG: hypothetical protein SGPRY_002952 [Prymnesium sp.]